VVVKTSLSEDKRKKQTSEKAASPQKKIGKVQPKQTKKEKKYIYILRTYTEDGVSAPFSS